MRWGCGGAGVCAVLAVVLTDQWWCICSACSDSLCEGVDVSGYDQKNCNQRSLLFVVIVLLVFAVIYLGSCRGQWSYVLVLDG